LAAPAPSPTVTVADCVTLTRGVASVTDNSKVAEPVTLSSLAKIVTVALLSTLSSPAV